MCSPPAPGHESLTDSLAAVQVWGPERAAVGAATSPDEAADAAIQADAGAITDADGDAGFATCVGGRWSC